MDRYLVWSSTLQRFRFVIATLNLVGRAPEATPNVPPGPETAGSDGRSWNGEGPFVSIGTPANSQPWTVWEIIPIQGEIDRPAVASFNDGALGY